MAKPITQFIFRVILRGYTASEDVTGLVISIIMKLLCVRLTFCDKKQLPQFYLCSMLKVFFEKYCRFLLEGPDPFLSDIYYMSSANCKTSSLFKFSENREYQV